MKIISEYTSAVNYLQAITTAGFTELQSHQTNDSFLEALENKLRVLEKNFLSNLGLNNINELIERIKKLDNNGLGALMPGKGIEQALAKKYDLSDSTKKAIDVDERVLVAEVLNELFNMGTKYVNTSLISAKSGATIRSDASNRILAAVNAGLRELQNDSSNSDFNIQLIGEPSISSPYLKNENENILLGASFIEIKGSLFRASQQTSDITLPTKNNPEVALGFKTTVTEKYTPLATMDQEIVDYLKSIAPIVLKRKGIERIQTSKDEITGKISLGSIPSPEKFKEIVVQELVQQLPEYSSAIYSFAPSIAIGRALPNLRGFLGEMRVSLLMFNLGFPVSEIIELRATGLEDKIKMTNDGKPEEAPIDFAVKILSDVYGIQVKNTDSSTYSWGNTTGIGAFYIERLQSTLGNKEAAMYKLLSYNQTIEEDQVMRKDMYKYIDYKKAYQEFEETLKKIATTIFNSNIVRIIRLTTDTQGPNSGIFTGHATLDNLFYMMQDKLISAADIVASLRGKITTNSNRGATVGDFISSSYTFNPGTSLLWEKGKPHEPPSTFDVNTTTLTYNITLRWKTLFNSAYNLS